MRFYNTLSQQVEEFVPIEQNVVRMYTCGPTVWNFVHIGNLRTFTFQDILRRWLAYRGYRLDHVMNITDVDDRIIQMAMGENKSIQEYTAQYEKAFLEDAALMRFERPERMVRATEHIPQMIALIARLAQKTYTYESDGSIYYRISKFPEYGKLSHLDPGGIRAGARVEVDRYDKDNARDFVLWKARKEGEPFWDTEFGPGRPGWHIECSAMAMAYLGDTLDIHSGGIDLTFPHHENEIAQSEGASGKPFAHYWLHSEHLMVEGQTMSKSLGNFFTLRDLLEKDYKPEAIRYLLASVPYRKQLNFSFDGLRSAATAIERLRNYELRLKTAAFSDGVNSQFQERAAAALQRFEESLDDDLNTAEALAAIFEYVRDTNTAMDAGEFRAGNVDSTLDLLARFDRIFDVLKRTPVTLVASARGESRVTAELTLGISDSDIDALVNERNQARKARNFARADEIRKELLDRGVILEDTKDGVRWKRK